MKNITKLLSALLAALMLLGSFTFSTSAIPLYSEDGKELKGEGDADYEETLNKYLDIAVDKAIYTTPQEKLASMTMMWEKHGYQLWIDDVTGEVATVRVATGEILFTNPWDTPTAQYTDQKTEKVKTTSLAIKKQLLSQIVVNYVDNDTEKQMYSCIEAAMRDQIDVEYIKNGIRVEYSIGREETRMLVPKLINRDRFQTKVLKPMREFFSEYYEELLLHNPTFDMAGPNVFINNTGMPNEHALDIFQVRKVAAFYQLKDPEAAETDRERSEMETAFPITKKMAVYVIDPGISPTEMTLVESYIKNYAPTYTYEDLDYDHELTEYVGVDKAPPLFKMALEYTIDEQGMSVRLPANGIRFDESLYQLTSIEMLPYMGAGSNDGDWTDGGDGYTFFPDGSGTLFDFEDLNNGKNKTVTGKVYGQDYAYHKISGTHQEVIRYPAFGIVDYWTGKKTVTDYDKVVTEAVCDENGNVVEPAEYGTKKVDAEEERGFLAIIEEGDALAELSTYHMSATSIYNTVKMVFYPRPKDSYNMSDAISVGSNTEMTVVSSRKYVGNYKVRYIMLSDDELAKEGNLSRYYECSWMGMAIAYRDYLEAHNLLERISDDQVDDDIPLYIETFGTLMTTEKILSIPVDVMTPLTSFEDIKTMYTELSDKIETEMSKLIAKGESVGTNKETAQNFSNINFKLTGYANGGMFSSVPYNLNWESAVGGAEGFEELVDYARQEGFGIFPDFDFVYINSFDTFDGVSLKEDAVKTIDNRYTSRREYSATYQSYIGYFQFAIAPSSFNKFVTKFTSNYIKYNPIGISVSTLGTDLNSDFDEDDPLNREDSKAYTIKALAKLATMRTEDGKDVEIMTDGGNAYTWKYVDHIVNIPLNSSRYNDSSNAVPFIGVVLHGYVQFAGSPINEEGDIEYAFLKAIENGAGIYFTLAYQNTQKLKDSEMLSQHFSVRYDIWKDDMVEMYAELNNLLCDLQTKLIIDHDFLTGNRIPSQSEILEDEEAKKKAEEEEKAIAEIEATKAALQAALKLRHTPTQSVELIESVINSVNDYVITIAKQVAKIDRTFVADCADIIKLTNSAKAELEEAKKTVYDNAAYTDSVEAAYEAMNNAIVVAATEVADEIFASASASVTDTAKLAAMRKAVNAAQSEILSAAIGVGAAEAFRQAINEEGTYTSSADKNAVARVEAEKVVNAICDAAAEAADGAKASAPAEHKQLVERVVNAVVDGIRATADVEVGLTGITAATTAYDEYVTANEKLVKTATDAAISLSTAINAAREAGIADDAINNALLLKEAVEVATVEVNALTANKNTFTTANTALISSAKTYLTNSVKDAATALAAGKTNVISAIGTILDYEYADVQVKIYELALSIDKNLDAANNSQARYDTSVANADKAKAKVDALDAAVVAEANAFIAEAKAFIADKAEDCYDDYVSTIKLVNEYYDAIAVAYEANGGKDVDVKDALQLINEQNRANTIKTYADKYLAANPDSIAASKAVNAAVEAQTIAKAEAAKIPSDILKSANTLINDKNGDLYKAVSKIARSYDSGEGATNMTTVDNYLKYLERIDARDAAVDGYKEYANNIVAAEAAKAAANEAFSKEAITVANTDARAVLNSAKAAYVAKVSKEDAYNTADMITTQLDKIASAKIAYEAAKASYEIQKAVVDSTYGATAAEIKELETRKTAMENEQSKLQLLQSDFDAAYAVSSCVAEFDAVVEAYNVSSTANANYLKINAMLKTLASKISAYAVLDADSAAIVEKSVLYTELQNSVTSATSEYSAAAKAAGNAFSRINAYYKSALAAVEAAEAAKIQLDERRGTTKENLANAEVVYKTYAAAQLVKNYTVEELEAMSTVSDLTDAEKLNYANAIAVAKSSLDALKSAYENASEADKPQADLLYNVALIAEEKTTEEINVSYNNAVAAMKTAEREVRSAEQFYNTAIEETELAKEKLAEFKAIYDANYDLYNGLGMLEARVLLFGEQNMLSYLTDANKDLIAANDLLAQLLDSVNIIEEQWAIIERAAKTYKSAKAAYDELNAKIESEGFETLTKDEIIAYRADRIYYSYKMTVAREELESAKTIIDSQCSLYKKNYNSINSSISLLTTSVENIEAEAESAKLLYEAKLKDTTVSAEELAEIKAIADDYAEKAMFYRTELNAVLNTFRYIVCEGGYELGILDVTDKTAAVEDRVYTTISQIDKHVKFINEAYGIVEEEKVVEEVTKYTCNDGSIVAVTYGGKGGEDSQAYRTFLLNYNSFAVSVEYDGVLYELDAYGYLVINH